ncbi:MAG: YqeG family HAD IIIA-type phosphatase [Prochlorococcaceae cyanobacterium]
MLRELLRPDWVLGSTVVELPVAQLLERGIRALVLDVDRTLLPRRQSHLPDLAELWLVQARAQLPIHLLSNNPSRRRIGAVADHMQLPFTTSAGKPRRSALRRVVNDLGLPMNQVALAGDRLFTDVLAGNRLGLYTVLVKPIDAQGQPCQRDRLQNLELRLARLAGTRLS